MFGFIKNKKNNKRVCVCEMSDLDEADLQEYGFYNHSSSMQRSRESEIQRKPRVRSRQEDDEQEQDDYEEEEQPQPQRKNYNDASKFPNMKPRNTASSNRQSDFVQQQQQPKKSVRFVEQEEEDDQIVPIDLSNPVVKRIKPKDNGDLFDGLKKVANLGPIEEQRKNMTIIPYYIHNAATTLVGAHNDRDINLSQAAFNDLSRLSACRDEFTTIDPIIVISDTLFTGSCNIYLKEAIPVSFLVLAHYLKLTYGVEVVPDVTSKSKLYTEVTVKPYHGKETKHAQEFGCEEAVKAALKQRGKNWQEMLKLVQIHYARVGAISPDVACDYTFIEAQLNVMSKVLSNVTPKSAEQEGFQLGAVDNTSAAKSSAEKYGAAKREQEQNDND